MDKSKMYIGQKVKIPSRDIVRWEGDEIVGFVKKITHQTEKILFVRELNDDNVGLSYSMDTPPERSFGVLYEHIHPCD